MLLFITSLVTCNRQLGPGESIPKLNSVEAVAALPPTSEALVAGVALMQPIFLRTAQTEGGNALPM